MNKFEKIIIVVTLSLGLVGGVALIALSFPPIVPSIFMATAISVLVYHFMGGIKEAGFNMGPVKMGGSIAALVGCAFVINHYLEPQMKKVPVIGKLHMNTKYEVRNEEETNLGTLNLSQLPIKLDKSQCVTLSDSIKLSNISDDDFKKLNLYNQVDFEDYTEVSFHLQLSPFRSELDESGKGLDSRRFRNAYHNLPFEIKPSFHKGSDKTQIIDKSSSKTIGYYTMERREATLVSSFIKSNSKLYIIRVRQLDRQSEENFVQYQIIGLKCDKT